MKKILITGGLGFIGTNVIMRFIHDADVEISIIDSYVPQVHTVPLAKRLKSFNSKKVQVYVEDLKNKDLGYLKEKKFDVIINMIAETGTGQSGYELNRYISNNVLTIGTLLENLVRKNIFTKKFIHLSSRAIYGEGNYKCQLCNSIYKGSERVINTKNDFAIKCPKCNRPSQPFPISEEVSPEPISIYGVTKLQQEEYLRWFYKHSKGNIDISILRLFNVYGPGQDPNNAYTGIIPLFIKNIYLNKPVNIYEDGEIGRDFIFIEDVVQAIFTSMSWSGYNICNVGSGESISLLNLVKTLFKLMGKEEKIEISGMWREGDVRNCVADISKLEALKFSPKYSIKKGLRLLLDAYRFENISSDSRIQEVESEGVRQGVIYKV